MSRSSSRLTSGRRSTPRTRVKIAALAPMPRARVSTTVITSPRSEEHTSELQSRLHLVCRLLLEKKINTLHDLIRDIPKHPPSAAALMQQYAHTALILRRTVTGITTLNHVCQSQALLTTLCKLH